MNVVRGMVVFPTANMGDALGFGINVAAFAQGVFHFLRSGDVCTVPMERNGLPSSP